MQFDYTKRRKACFLGNIEKYSFYFAFLNDEFKIGKACGTNREGGRGSSTRGSGQWM